MTADTGYISQAKAAAAVFLERVIVGVVFALVVFGLVFAGVRSIVAPMVARGDVDGVAWLLLFVALIGLGLCGVMGAVVMLIVANVRRGYSQTPASANASRNAEMDLAQDEYMARLHRLEQRMNARALPPPAPAEMRFEEAESDGGGKRFVRVEEEAPPPKVMAGTIEAFADALARGDEPTWLTLKPALSNNKDEYTRGKFQLTEWNFIERSGQGKKTAWTRAAASARASNAARLREYAETITN